MPSIDGNRFTRDDSTKRKRSTLQKGDKPEKPAAKRGRWEVNVRQHSYDLRRPKDAGTSSSKAGDSVKRAAARENLNASECEIRAKNKFKLDNFNHTILVGLRSQAKHPRAIWITDDISEHISILDNYIE